MNVYIKLQTQNYETFKPKDAEKVLRTRVTGQISVEDRPFRVYPGLHRDKVGHKTWGGTLEYCVIAHDDTFAENVNFEALIGD